MYADISPGDDDRGNGESDEGLTYLAALSANNSSLPGLASRLIVVWGVVSTSIAFLLSLAFEKIFRIPQWAKLGVCFPNALSLPLLLLNSLKESSIIEQLVWGPDDTVTNAVRRGRTYILVYLFPVYAKVDQLSCG
jgi:hypothetical protein